MVVKNNFRSPEHYYINSLLRYCTLNTEIWAAFCYNSLSAPATKNRTES